MEVLTKETKEYHVHGLNGDNLGECVPGSVSKLTGDRTLNFN